MSQQLKILLACGLSVLGVILVLGLGADSVLPGVAGWLNVGQRPACVDHVLVLPGDENTRPAVAAALVNVGLGRDILVPETRVSHDERDGVQQANAEIIRAVLRHRGIPEERIVTLRGASGSTYDDVRALARFLEDSGPGRVAVVTSGFHTRRTRFTLDHVLGSQADQIVVIAAPYPGFVENNWWRSGEGFRLIIDENIKLALYLLRYGSLTPWIVAGCGIALLVVVISYRHRASQAVLSE